MLLEFKQSLTFDWDGGNILKNLLKHKVGYLECEEVFGDPCKVIFRDVLHSDKETRYILVGKTRQDRSLYLVFTLRGKKIRVISARDLSRKERYFYEKSN